MLHMLTLLLGVHGALAADLQPVSNPTNTERIAVDVEYVVIGTEVTVLALSMCRELGPAEDIMSAAKSEGSGAGLYKLLSEFGICFTLKGPTIIVDRVLGSYQDSAFDGATVNVVALRALMVDGTWQPMWGFVTVPVRKPGIGI